MLSLLGDCHCFKIYLFIYLSPHFAENRVCVCYKVIKFSRLKLTRKISGLFLWESEETHNYTTKQNTEILNVEGCGTENINLLQTERNLLYIRIQIVPCRKRFPPRL